MSFIIIMLLPTEEWHNLSLSGEWYKHDRVKSMSAMNCTANNASDEGC